MPSRTILGLFSRPISIGSSFGTSIALHPAGIAWRIRVSTSNRTQIGANANVCRTEFEPDLSPISRAPTHGGWLDGDYPCARHCRAIGMQCLLVGNGLHVASSGQN